MTLLYTKAFEVAPIGTCLWKKGFAVVVVQGPLMIGRNVKLMNQISMTKC